MLAAAVTFNDLLSKTIEVQGFSHQNRQKAQSCHEQMPTKPIFMSECCSCNTMRDQGKRAAGAPSASSYEVLRGRSLRGPLPNFIELHRSVVAQTRAARRYTITRTRSATRPPSTRAAQSPTPPPTPPTASTGSSAPWSGLSSTIVRAPLLGLPSLPATCTHSLVHSFALLPRR